MSRTPASRLSLCVIAAVIAAPGCDRVAPLGRFLHGPVPRQVPALSVIVVSPEKLLFDDSIGVRDAAHNAMLAPGAIFRIASMTKPITSLAAMMLHEEGRLDLDAPVSRYLPDLDGSRVITSEVRQDKNGLTYDSRPPVRPMLVRHLLTHTSGIGYPFVDERIAALDEGTKTWTNMTFLSRATESCSASASAACRRPPRSAHRLHRPERRARRGSADRDPSAAVPR